MNAPRPFAPLKADHPLVTDERECAACNSAFQAGEVVTLVALGPGDDEEARQKVREGRPYNAVSAPCHWACVTGSDDPEGDWRRSEGTA